jgi:Secretion system C-terminal sorting domain
MNNFSQLRIKNYSSSFLIDLINYSKLFSYNSETSLHSSSNPWGLSKSISTISNAAMTLIVFVFFMSYCQNAMAQGTGPSTAITPYVLPVASGVTTTSLLTVPETVAGYKMVGIPDGLGAYDNNNGTFTLLMNHELGNTSGVARAHGAAGAFVSKWIINKSNLSIVSGSDLITSAYGWDTATQAVNATSSTIAFNRFCSADLPAVSAFYNAATGLGTQARIFMNGEEGGSTGYQVATVASGPNAGKAYVLGKFNLSTNGSGITAVGAWENALANSFAQDKTIVVGNNDGGTGIMNNSVCVYQGIKTNTGTEVDKAGLTNGTLKFINVTGNPLEIPAANATTRATNITSGTAFTLSTTTSTTFSRPEDGAWDPSDPSKYYFVTTDRLDQVNDGIGTTIGRSRLWRLNFTAITNPDLGGTIDLLLDGTEGQVMMDNMCFDNYGHILLLEDVGNNAHNGKIWQYTIGTDQLKLLAKHDPARFGDIVAGVPQSATLPFTIDEETSGIIDMADILGAGNFLLVDQAHYLIAGDTEAVEGGQLLKLFNPDSFNSSLSTNSFETVSNFEVITYPNPYDSSFEFNLQTTSDDQIEMKVYDMVGKLLETCTLNVAELNDKKIGADYQSGMYNVSITQGTNTKILRVIKK